VIAAARASSRKRSSARDSLSSTSSTTDPSLKLKFLANLSQPSGKSLSSIAEDASTAPVDIMAQLNLYDAGENLYEILPRQARSRGGKSYVGNIVAGLVREQEKGDEGGFVVEEVWEKCVRAGVSGLWDLPLDWEEVAVSSGEGNQVEGDGMKVH